MSIRFEDLSEGQQEALRAAWASNHHYGEPCSYRGTSPRDSHLLTLHSLGLVYNSRYQGEPCFWPTKAGIACYISSRRFSDDCYQIKTWARPGT